jgi:hypothetical protein
VYYSALAADQALRVLRLLSAKHPGQGHRKELSMQRYVTLMVIILAALLPAPVWAQPTEEMCYLKDPPPPFFARKVVQLVEAISVRPSREPGVFYRNWTEIDYQEGQAVILTGSQDLYPYKTDDLMRLTASPSGKVWEHDFRSTDRMTIVPQETYQDITDMLVPGVNTLEIVLEDILGPEYSSSSYWVIVLEPCPAPQPEASQAATATPVPTELPPTAIAPTATATEVQGVAFSEGPLTPSNPLHESAVEVQPTAANTPVLATAAMMTPEAEGRSASTQVNTGDVPASVPIWRWIMLSFALMGGGLAWAWQRYRPDWRTQITAWTALLHREGEMLWKQFKTEVLQPKR